MRGLVRTLSGLALVAVLTACGSDENPEILRSADSDLASAPAPSPTESTTPTPLTPDPEEEPAEQSEEPLDPSEGRASEIRGAYSLAIPKIDVTAPVVSIKNSEQRVLVPPRDPTIVGWWSEGARPGSPEGSAVFVGHTVRSGGGVFDDVGELSSGDTVEVTGSSGTLTYRVESIEVLSKDELARAAEGIFDQSGAGRLVIVTCEDWDGSAWQSNIVTIATPV